MVLKVGVAYNFFLPRMKLFERVSRPGDPVQDLDVEGEHGDGAKDVLNFHQDNHAVQRLVHIVTKGDTEQQVPETDRE